MRSNITDEAIVSYLLGEIPGEERERFEHLYLEDESVFNQLLAVEDELIFDFARGDLPPARRDRFEKHFLTSLERRERLAFAREMLASLARGKAEREGQPQPEVPLFEPWWRRLLAFFEPRGIAARLALTASAIILLIVVSGLLLGGLRSRREITRLEAERAVLQRDRQELEQEVGRQQIRGNELSRRIDEEQSRTRLLEQQLAETRGSQSSIVSFVPRISTRGSESFRVVIPPRATLVRFIIEFDTKLTYERYQVTLNRVGSGSQPSSEILSEFLPGPRAKGKEFLVDIPSSMLAVDDYMLTLYGITKTENEQIASYFVHVSKR